MTPFFAELIGTMVLILLGDGIVANALMPKTKGNNAGWISITTAWALAVFVGVVIAGPYSGAHLNPAVTLGLAIAGTFEWALVPEYVVAQLIGAALGALLVWGTYRDHYKLCGDRRAILSSFCTSPEIRHNTQNFFTEMVGTFVLMITVFYITNGEIVTDGPIGTIPVGLGSVGALPVAFTVWVIGLSLGGPTGYAINPARDLAPRVIHSLLPIAGKGSSEWSYAWIPVFGPLCGAALAAGLYFLLNI